MIRPRTRIMGLAAGLVLATIPALAPAQTTIGVDPLGAYLHVDTSDAANGAVPISLTALGLSPGSEVNIKEVGDWNNGPGGDIFTTMLGVFSGSATLLDSSLLHRVPGAIDAGLDVDTPYTWPNSQPMDIVEDFGFDSTGLTIVIPPGAAYLFVSVRDNYYRDNSDPDGDLGVRLTPVASPVPAADASPAMTVSPNPFNPATTLRFSLPVGGRIRLDVVDVAGRLVRKLLDGDFAAGRHEARWDGRDDTGRGVASGSYFARLVEAERTTVTALSLVR